MKENKTGTDGREENENKKGATMPTWNAVDFGALLEDLVGQLLSGGQHFRVVFGDEILHEFLQLLAIHLQQRFCSVQTTGRDR